VQPQEEAMDLVAMVRARDYRRFIAIQLAQPAMRPALYAVTAFASDMARVPAMVSEPLAGFMRFAWWREALEEMEQGRPVRHHPILLALAALQAVPFHALQEIITAGQYRLEDPDLPDHMDEKLDHAWRALLGEAATKPMRALALLPINTRLGPRHLWRVLVMGIRP